MVRKFGGRIFCGAALGLRRRLSAAHRHTHRREHHRLGSQASHTCRAAGVSHRLRIRNTVGVISSCKRFAGDSIPDLRSMSRLRYRYQSVNHSSAQKIGLVGYSIQLSTLLHCANRRHPLRSGTGDGLLPRQTASRLMTPTDRAESSGVCSAVVPLCPSLLARSFARLSRTARMGSGWVCRRQSVHGDRLEARLAAGLDRSKQILMVDITREIFQ